MADDATNADPFAKFVNLDMSGYIPPSIVFHQKDASTPPRTYPFDHKALVYDKELSSPTVNNYRNLFAKYRLPSAPDAPQDSGELVDVLIETPVLQPLFGLSAFKNEHTRNGKTVETTNYSLLLSFNNIFNNTEQLQFFRAMRLWDEEIVHQVFANKNKWLPGVAANIKTPESVELLFSGVTALRKRARDGQVFAPALHLRIAKKGAAHDVTVIDRNNNPTDIKNIQPSSDLRVVFRHKVCFQSKSIDVRNEAVLIQLLDPIRPMGFANAI